MATFEFEWNSTVIERYDTTMREDVEKIIVRWGGRIVGAYGGSDGRTADNGIQVDLDEDTAKRLQVILGETLKRDVTLRKVND